MATRNTKKVLGTVLALGAATGAIVFGSFAAWTANTTNPGNTVATGTFAFSNDQDAAADLFAVTNAKPGQTGTAPRISVTNDGTVAASAVTLTQTGSVHADLVAHMQVQIEDVASGDCLYPADTNPCGANYGAWSGGTLDTPGLSLGTWAAGATRQFDIGWKFADTNTTASQGKTANFALNWAATS